MEIKVVAPDSFDVFFFTKRQAFGLTSDNRSRILIYVVIKLPNIKSSTHLEEPLAMLVENSFKVKSCFSRAGHNFSRFSRPRLRHFKFRCCCEQTVCIFLQNFSVENTSWPGTTCNLITCVQTWFPEYSEVLRRIHDNYRTDVAEKTGDGECALHLF